MSLQWTGKILCRPHSTFTLVFETTEGGWELWEQHWPGSCFQRWWKGILNARSVLRGSPPHPSLVQDHLSSWMGFENQNQRDEVSAFPVFSLWDNDSVWRRVRQVSLAERENITFCLKNVIALPCLKRKYLLTKELLYWLGHDYFIKVQQALITAICSNSMTTKQPFGLLFQVPRYRKGDALLTRPIYPTHIFYCFPREILAWIP